MRLVYDISSTQACDALELPADEKGNRGMWNKRRNERYDVEVIDTRDALDHFLGNNAGLAKTIYRFFEEMNADETPEKQRNVLITRSKNLPRDFGLWREHFIQGLYETIKQRVPVYGAVTYAKLAEFAEFVARTDFWNPDEVDNLYDAICPFVSVAERMYIVPLE